MTTSSTPYSAQVRITELLERGKAQNTELKIFRDGSQIVPTSATYTLSKPDSGYIVEGGAATVALDGTCTYAHSAGQMLDTLILGEGYIQEWAVVISGETYTFRRMAAIVLRRLYPVISDVDLTELYSDLEALRPSSMSSYQSYIDSAWYTILRKIRSIGAGYEYLVTSPESFAEAHRHLALYNIFRDFHSSLGQSNGRYLDLAQEHHKLYIDEFNTIKFVYDEGHTGKPDEPDKRKSAHAVVFLTGAPYYRRSKFRRR